MTEIKRMRKVLVLVTVLMMVAVFVLTAEPAEAQRTRGGTRGGSRGGSRGSLTELLSNEQVQKELKLTEADVAKIKAINEKLRTDRTAQYTELRKIKDADERRAKYAELRAESSAKVLKQFQDVLSKKQMDRLQQISTQQQSALESLSSKSVADKLELTDAQKKKITEIAADYRAKRSKLPQTARDATAEQRAAASKKRSELTAAADKQALELLTDKQSKAFEEMKGEKFELKRTPRTPRQRTPKPATKTN